MVEAESIEASEGDILDALTEASARENGTPEDLRKRLEQAGRLDDLRDDIAQRAAIDFLVEHAVTVTPKPEKKAKAEPKEKAEPKPKAAAKPKAKAKPKPKADE